MKWGMTCHLIFSTQYQRIEITCSLPNSTLPGISAVSQAFVSKWRLLHNHLHENQLNLHANVILFEFEGLDTKTHFRG